MDHLIYDIAKKQTSGIALGANEKSMLASFLHNEEQKAMYDELIFVLTQTLPEKIILAIDVDAEWEQFKSLRNASATTKMRRLVIQWSSAAAVAILISVFVFMQQAGREIIYASGSQVEQYTLPDNSIVTLNKNSRLVLPKNFNKNIRMTQLDGEAFFNVTHNASIPFVVSMSNGTTVKVLGTRFNLRSFSQENVTDLQVLEGKVSFGYKDKEPALIVAKGTKAQFDKTTNSFEPENNVNEYIAMWQSGEFSFDNAPITQLFESFERFFNKVIVYPSSSTALNYSGQFVNPNESDFAKIIGLAFGWNYKITKQQIIFSLKE